MTRHWRPEGKVARIVPVRERGRPDWTRPGSYRRSRVGLWIFGIAAAGGAGGLGWQWWHGPVTSVPTAAIEWNAVQAVPTRAPDAEDVAWEERAQPEPSPSWGGLGGGAALAQADDADERLSSAADATGPPPTSPTRGEAIYVIDGDTFSYRGQRIRIAGMDAPEIHPPRCLQEAQLGHAATEKLRSLLSGGTVTVSGAGHDQYGRELRTVRVDGVDVAQTMISAGLATSYAGKKRQSWC